MNKTALQVAEAPRADHLAEQVQLVTELSNISLFVYDGCNSMHALTFHNIHNILKEQASAFGTRLCHGTDCK